jgi:hypothetical protein
MIRILESTDKDFEAVLNKPKDFKEKVEKSIWKKT